MKKHYLSLILLLFSCATNPTSHRLQLNLVPDSKMNSLGADSFAQLKKDEKSKIITSGPQFEQIKSVGMKIAQASGANFDWEFVLIKEDKTVNAFCLPGGKIGVYTGILPMAQSEAGLAAVLGHEVAHAVLKHGAERMSQAMLVQAGLGVAQLTLQNKEQQGTILAALGLGAQYGVMMPFSRTHESEADTIGLQYMAKAGFDIFEAPRLWERMAKEGGKVPELLSTHPDPSRRAQDLAREVGRVSGTYQMSQKQPTKSLIL